MKLPTIQVILTGKLLYEGLMSHMSDKAEVSQELEALIQNLVRDCVDQMKVELVAYIDEKLRADSATPEQPEGSDDPVTLSMIMLQISAIFEKFSHYDEIYRTYGIEADAFQDECNETLDVMRYQVEQFESQLKDFQNRLHIEESGGESAIRHNVALQDKFEALSKEVQETLGQFDQYCDAQLNELESIPDALAQIKSELERKQNKSEAFISLQESKSELLAKVKAAVNELNQQLPKVVASQIKKARG